MLRGLNAESGEDGARARHDLVEALFGAGRDADADAEAELRALAHDPELYEGHCELVAELLVLRVAEADALR